MDVNPVTSASAARNSAAEVASNRATLDYDTFLTLLVEQMRNQDPTEPMDATDQIAQLATFSQVEQTIETNRNLELLLQSSNLTQAGSIIGRTLTSADGAVTGIVDEVKVSANGLTAILTTGEEFAVTSGVSIR